MELDHYNSMVFFLFFSRFFIAAATTTVFELLQFTFVIVVVIAAIDGGGRYWWSTVGSGSIGRCRRRRSGSTIQILTDNPKAAITSIVHRL